MRRYIKRQLAELLNTMEEATESVLIAIKENDVQQYIELLAELQDISVTVGNEIDASEGEDTEAVHLLELGCELLWQLSQEENISNIENGIAQLNHIFQQVLLEMEEFAEQLDVVFLPYKASMWECMESVWEAACEDEKYYPIVMPIPYFDLERGQVKERHYEGEQFPPYVPITDYNSLPLEELQPDMIFIHNAFDGGNLITSVLPRFYSDQLKAVTRRLIYIPYFITGSGVYATHRYLPAYKNVDFIVAQCENTIASYAEYIPREKFLPLGSPIADRIIKLEREKPAIPEEWKPMLPNGQDFGGKRVVMLNTSISLLMKARHRFLNKIEYIFDMVKEMDGILLVWRPHPLLHATVAAMGEEYVERLNTLEQRFLTEKLGVLDKTADVGVTVALCDAYLGEDASSLIHMFGIAGKPRFYINLVVPRRQFVETEIEYEVTGYCKEDESEYYLLDKPGWIVKKDTGIEEWMPFLRIPDREYIRDRAYLGMEIKDGSLWLYPDNALGTLVYDIQNGRMKKVFDAFDTAQVLMGKETEGTFFLKSDSECFRVMMAERFIRGNYNHEWYEGVNSCLEDYFRFLLTTEKEKLSGNLGMYPIWLANLDGSCGNKVLEAVKKSLCEEA